MIVMMMNNNRKQIAIKQPPHHPSVKHRPVQAESMERAVLPTADRWTLRRSAANRSANENYFIRFERREESPTQRRFPCYVRLQLSPKYPSRQARLNEASFFFSHLSDFVLDGLMSPAIQLQPTNQPTTTNNYNINYYDSNNKQTNKHQKNIDNNRQQQHLCTLLLSYRRLSSI